MKKNERLKTYKQRRTNRDKRHFRRIYNMEMPTFMFCMFRIPKVLILILIHLIIGKDVIKPWFDMIYISRIRRHIMYYRKKADLSGEKVKFKYYIDENYIEVMVYFGRKAKDLEYDQLAKACAISVDMNYTEITQRKGYYTFTVFPYPIAKNEILIDVENHKICIGQGYNGNVWWEFDVYSCCLIAGKPRNGKSVFVTNLIYSIVDAKWHLWVIDGKDVDYIAMADMFTRYIDNHDVKEIIEFVDDFHKEMLKRYAIMREYKVKKYIGLDMVPCFLMCDEFLSVAECVKNYNKKEHERFISVVGDIVRRGPASGMQFIASMQRADTTYFSGEIRSNMQLKVVTGAGDESLYKMMFENTDNLKPLPVGYAWYGINGSPNELAVPFLEGLENKRCQETKDEEKNNVKAN